MRIGTNYQTTNMNDMKHTITSQLAVLLLFAAGMAGCSEEDALPGGTTTNPDSDRCPMTVSVSDGGYTASHPSAPGTRAAENGYTTRFTAGDKIGLYAVKDGAIVTSNVCLTAADNGSSGIAWTGNAYYEGAGTKYFAYYPWQSTLSGSPDASATDASGFFADVISRWTPATDQGTYARYTAQDLMTGSSTPGNKQPDGTYPLSFTLTHAMALVVIETPTTKYKLTDASGNSLPDYNIPAPDTRFYGFTPCSLADTYRYLVKPSQSGAGDLMGSYTATTDGATATKEYAVTQNGLTAASYVLYKVDNATVTEISHTLQAGDFYLSDGSLVGKDATLSAAQQAACIGIVLKAGRDGDGSDWKDDCNYKLKGTTTPMTDIHGYVLGLYDAKDEHGNTVTPQWGSRGLKVDHADMNREQNTGFYGYKNTNAIKAFAEQNGKTLQTDFPAAYYATEAYERSYPAPANSSGWFLPSAGQGKYWLNNREVILASVRKATGNSRYNWQYYYWSSSEDDGSPEASAWYVRFNLGEVGWDYKRNGNHVRGVFAF